MGPQEDYIETVLTCEGDYYDPDFHKRLENFSERLQNLILAENGKLILKKVEPWNSVRVTFNIPKEAAVRLKQLAEQGDRTLRDLGILAVQIEGDRSISLTIAGKNNETTELVFRTSHGPASNPSSSVFDTSSEDILPVPNLEATRANIVECLRVQSETGPHGPNLLDMFISQQQQPPQQPPSVAIPTSHVNQPVYASPSRSPSHSASSVGSQLPVPAGKSPPGFPSPSQSVSQQSFPSPGSSRSQPSPVSPQYPTPPPSQPSHPGSPGIRLPLAYTHNNPTVNNVQHLRPNKDVTTASPLLVTLLQTEVHQQPQQHFNNVPQLPMPPPIDGGPPNKKRKRTRKRDKLKDGPFDGEIRVPGIPGLSFQNDSRVPPIGAGPESFMLQSPSLHGDGSLQGLASSLPASLSRPSTPSSQQAHSWGRHPASPSANTGTVTPPSGPTHNMLSVRCSPDKPANNPQHIINPVTGQLEPVDVSGLSVENMKIKIEASDTYGDVSSQLKPPPNPLVAIQQHMAASENSGQHRVSSPSSNTSNQAANSNSILSGLPVSRLPPYSSKPKTLHRSGSPANTGGVPVGVGSVTLPGSSNVGSMVYSSVLSGLKRSNSGLFAQQSSASSSQGAATMSSQRHRYSPVTSLASVSGSSLVSTVSSVLSGEKNHLSESSAISNPANDSRLRSNCSAPHAQNNISVSQGISMVPSDRTLTVTSVISQVTKSESASLPSGASMKLSRIHSPSPTASLSLSVSQTLSSYPDRSFPSSSLISGLDSSLEIRPSSCTPLSSRSSTPKSHDSVMLASHFIPIPRDSQETFSPSNTVKEEPASQVKVEASAASEASSSQAGPGTLCNTPVTTADQQMKGNSGLPVTSVSTAVCEPELKHDISRPQTLVSSAGNSLPVSESLAVRTSGAHATNVHVTGNGAAAVSSAANLSTSVVSIKSENPAPTDAVKPNPGMNIGAVVNEHQTIKQETPSEESKPAGLTPCTSNSHGHSNTGEGNSPQSKPSTTSTQRVEETKIERQLLNDSNNHHDQINDRLYDGKVESKLLDVPPLLNPHEGGMDSVIHSDLQTIPRGSNGASMGEASPVSSDNASSSGQPNAGQSPVTNMVGHMNHDSELSSNSFEDHVSAADDSSNIQRHNHSGTSSKDRENVSSQRPTQTDHKNIITVGYAFSRDTPVDLNNGFANDKLFKNLNNMPFLTKPFLALESSEVKGVRMSTDFLQKDKMTGTLVRQGSQEAPGEKFRVKTSLISENHLNLTNCLPLPAKLMGKSDLNPGGLADKPAQELRVNGSAEDKTASQPVTDHFSSNGAEPPKDTGNGVLTEKTPVSSALEVKRENGGDAGVDVPLASVSTAVVVISSPNALIPSYQTVSKNEAALPSSRGTVWAGSEMAPRLPSTSEHAPTTTVEQSPGLILHTTGSNDNALASSRTVIMAASSAPVFTSESASMDSGIECRCATGSCQLACHQQVPSSMPSLIPADRPSASNLPTDKSNGPSSSQQADHAREVKLLRATGTTTDSSDKLHLLDGVLKATPNGDHSGVSGLLTHHSKVAQTKGISILKPLHDREDEGVDDLIYPSPEKKPVVIAGLASQESPLKTPSQPSFMLSSMMADDKLPKDNLLRVIAGHKTPRATYSKGNTKSSFSDFPNNSNKHLTGFANRSKHTPAVHNSQTITAPGFHLTLTESVQGVIPSMDTLSPPHDKSSFSLPPVNQSPPAAEKRSPTQRSPTQKLHSGKITPEQAKGALPESPNAKAAQMKSDHYLAMNRINQRFHARTTSSSVINLGSIPRTITAALPVTTSHTVSGIQVLINASPVKSEALALFSEASVCSTAVTSVRSEVKPSDVELSGTLAANDCHTSGCLTVKAGTLIGVKLDPDKDILETKAMPIEVAESELVPSKSETITLKTVKSDSSALAEGQNTNSDIDCKTEEPVKTDTDCRSETDTRADSQPAKAEGAARSSRRLQARLSEQSTDHETETGQVRPGRTRKYSTESMVSESSEVASEGMSTRSGRTRRASTESSKSVDEHCRRSARCNSRESTESRSASTESGHSKEESPRNTRSHKKSESSEDHLEDKRSRLADLRTMTPSPTLRATRTSTRSVKKKFPEGIMEEQSQASKVAESESVNKTRCSKRKLALEEEVQVPEKKARETDSITASVANRVRGKQEAVKTPGKESPAQNKVSPSKENVADEHSYSNKKAPKPKPAVLPKKPAVMETVKTRQISRPRSPAPELSGRNRTGKAVGEEKTVTPVMPVLSTTPGTPAVKRSTRSTRAKDVPEPATATAASKRQRSSRDQR